MLLPAGKYTVTYTRGPEYRVAEAGDRRARVRRSTPRAFRVERWINLADAGWYSGDHHVHAAGCAHYSNRPRRASTPEDMMRHILGEDLNVGCVLTWGPCWYHQKQFFDGKVHVTFDAAESDALRRGGIRLPQLARRATWCCCG